MNNKEEVHIEVIKEIPIPLVKSNQIFLVLGTLIAVVFQLKFLVLFLFAAVSSSLFFGPRANLAFRIAKPILAHRLFYALTESIELQRFNQMIAFTCLLLSVVFMQIAPIVSWAFCAFVTIAASFALGGYCLGCAIYYPYKMWLRNNRHNYPHLHSLFDFVAGTGKFKPPFQFEPEPLMIMGLAHESIRNAIHDIHKMIHHDADGVVGKLIHHNHDSLDFVAIKKKIDELNRFINHHAHQEDHRMYPPIDKKSKGITSKFGAEHEEIEHLEKEIENLFDEVINKKSDSKALVTALDKWCDYSNKHLRHEEAILMPKIPKLLKFKESCEVVLSILDLNEQEYIDFHLEYAFRSLKPGQRYNYVHILHSCCPEEQFGRYEAVLKPLVPAESWVDFVSGATLV